MLTPELILQRRGNITASEAHSIMTGWDIPRPTDFFNVDLYDWMSEHKRKPLVKEASEVAGVKITSAENEAAWKAYRYDLPSQGLVTYAEKLACDELFDEDPSLEFTSAHMENGNERELEATELLIEATGLDFVKTGEDQMHVSVDGIGATPDGIVYDDMDLIFTGCEIKCRSPLHHARQILIEDNATLKELDFSRFCQMQVACLVSGADHWYSASYNPYAKSPAHRFYYCVISRDDEFLKIFKQRAALTFKHKAIFLEKLNSRIKQAA